MKPVVVINRDQIAWLISGAITGDLVRFKAMRVQAVCCEVLDANQVDHIAAGLMSQPRISSANKKIVAFRLGTEEWFDDSEEAGIGVKLIKVLRQYGKENLMLVVCLWDDGMPLKYGSDVFGTIMRCASEVIGKYHAISSAEVIRPHKADREIAKTHLLFEGSEHTPLPSSQVIIQPKKDRFRPFSLDRYYTAVAHLEQVTQTLRPADLHELLTSRCHIEITLVCECFCTLMGRRNPGWADVRELLGNANIIGRIKALDLRTIKPDLVRQVASVLSAHPSITIPHVLQLSPAAATLLKWCESVVIIYTGLHDIERAELDKKLMQTLKGEGNPAQETIEMAELRVSMDDGRLKRDRVDPVMQLLSELQKTTLGELGEDDGDREKSTTMD